MASFLLSRCSRTYFTLPGKAEKWRAQKSGMLTSSHFYRTRTYLFIVDYFGLWAFFTCGFVKSYFGAFSIFFCFRRLTRLASSFLISCYTQFYIQASSRFAFSSFSCLQRSACFSQARSFFLFSYLQSFLSIGSLLMTFLCLPIIFTTLQQNHLIPQIKLKMIKRLTSTLNSFDDDGKFVRPGRFLQSLARQNKLEKSAKLLFLYFYLDNNYKMSMQEISSTVRADFYRIGKTNGLADVTCSTAKPSHVAYLEKKLEKHAMDFAMNQENRSNNTISSSNAKGKTEDGSKDQNYFWPTDIAHDKSGKAVKQLRSYIETHKINSYIKLNLPSSQTPTITITSPPITQQAQFSKPSSKLNSTDPAQQASLKSNRSSTVSHQRDSYSEGRSRKEDKDKGSGKGYIKIDYEVVTIGRKERRGSYQDQTTPFIAYLSQHNKEEGIRPGSNKIYIGSNSKPSQLIGKSRTLDQKPTPNTSTHNNTLNTLPTSIKQKSRVVRKFLQEEKLASYDSNNQEEGPAWRAG